MSFYFRPFRLLPVLMALAVGCGSSSGSDERAAGGDGGASAEASQEVGRTPVGAARPAPDHAWVVFDGDTVVAELARTPDERARGLMHRTELPEGSGMLFVFEDQGIRSFWMQDTYVPLDIAFIDADLRVVDIQRMEPRTTDPHESVAPAMFALEVPAGWFAAHGVAIGDRVELVF